MIATFLLMSEAEAAGFRENTDELEHRLEPRLITNGQYAGFYALPEQVINDPFHLASREALSYLQPATFEIDEAWPPSLD